MNKFLILTLAVTLFSCKYEKRYTKRKIDFQINAPTLVADQSGRTNDTIKLFSGQLKNSNRISFHSQNSCSNSSLIVESSKANFETSGINVNLISEGINNIYIKVYFNNGDIYCYPNPQRIYERDTTPPTITLNSPSNDIESNYLLGISLQGSITDNITTNNPLTLNIYRNSSNCSQNLLLSSVANNFQNSGISLTALNLQNNKYYAEVSDSLGNTNCVLLYDYTHIVGPISETNSTWTVEKNIVSPTIPESNKISLVARDINNNLVASQNIEINLKDLKLVNSVNDVLLTLTEVSTGNYEGTAQLTYSYSVNINNGSITSFTNRFIQNVYATSNPYCFTSGRDSWTNYNQSGLGTSISPYEICQPEQLKSLANNCNTTTQDACDKNYILLRDIDLVQYYAKGTASNQEFILASDINNPYIGEFDGNNYKILNYKYSQDNNEFKGMFGYLNNSVIKNLEYSYDVNNALITNVGGLAKQMTGSSTELSKLKVSGNINVSNLATIGGVVNFIQVDAADIKNNTINISIDNLSKGGGFSSDLIGLNNIQKINFSENKIVTTINQQVSTNNTSIGGTTGTANNVEFDNNIHQVNISLNNNSGTANVGGIGAVVQNSSIDHSYITGIFIDVGVGVNNLGGMIAFVDNTTITNGFSLTSINVPDCTSKCGKILGNTVNTSGTFFLELYSSLQTSVNLGAGFLNYAVQETDIDLSSQPNYFTDKLNPPLDSFDFTNIWQENLNIAYPSLLNL